ncbi:LuxR C-terminal-related transcriptional regulator [Sanguibacter sp. 25GB23B1]|uniref:LuxR C-terminal-related transcriptional regulator n=1 Tax=unclassified Sanguibacter TaxID=2645534 RepID=UPI0032B00E11
MSATAPAGPSTPDGPATRVPGTPRLPRSLLVPPSVLDVLDAGHPITVLRAPHGYGKSAVVASWLAGTGAVGCWYTVPHETSDLTDLLRHLLRELGGAVPAGDVGAQDAQDALAAAVRNQGARVVVVLDRYDRVSAPGAEALLARLVEQCPTLFVVLCCQELPETRLARLGVDAVVVGPDQLALDRSAVGELAASLGVPLDPDRAAELHDALWGWPTPTRALLTAHAARSAGTAARTFDWDVAMLHLTEGSAWSETPETDEFLLRTRFVDSVTADVADLLTGRTDSATLLAHLETAGLARSVLDGRARRYTYLPALRTAHAERVVPGGEDIERDAHRKAREVFADSPELAIHHAAATDDWDGVLSIADGSWGRLVAHHPQRLRTVLARVPGRFLKHVPRLLVVRDVLLHSRNDRVATQEIPWPSPDAELDDSEVRDLAGAAIGRTIALRQAFRFQNALEVVDRLQDTVQSPDGRWHGALADVLPFLLVQSGVVRFVAGDLAGARRDFLDSYRSGRGTDLEFLSRHGLEFAALVDALDGETTSAVARLDAAQALATTPAALRRTVDPVEPLVRALVAVEQLDLEAADEWLSAVPAQENERSARISAWFARDIAAATVAHLRGSPSLGLTLLDRARHHAGGRVTPGALAYRLVTQAQVSLTLRDDNPTRALNLLRAYPFPRDAVVRAQLALQAGDPVEATAAATTGLLRGGASRAERVTLLLVDMAARHAAGVREAAVDALRSALALADTGVLRPFAEASRDVLEDLAADVPEIVPVLDAVDASPVLRIPAPTAPLIDLSARELAVLEALEHAGSSEVLARHLFVSVNTVKSQTRSLYRKLGVTNRESALGAGHTLGYLGLVEPD